MPILLTAQNVDFVLGTPNPERLAILIPEVFERLLDPNLDAFTRYTYCKSIHDRLESRSDPDQTATGFDIFTDICFNGGIVDTFLQIAKEPSTERWPALAAYFALQTMWMLMRKGDIEDRDALLKQLLDHNIVDFLLDTIENSHLVIHRQGAIAVLRCLAAECTLGACLSPVQTSTIVTQMCEFILSGPQFFIEQFGDASLTWQSFLSFGKFGSSKEKARKYAPRNYAMAQENAAWTIQGLFIRCPPPNSRFRYQVLKHNPSVIDLLFKIAAMERPPWYADLEAGSILCESIVLIFRLPELVIPGVDVRVESSDVQKEKEEEWGALVDCLKLLTSRPKWVDLLCGVWNHLEAERPNQLKKMLMEAESKYFAMSPYSAETFYLIFEARGSSRICMERLIATLIYATAENKLSHDVLFSLLRITNAAVRLSKSPNRSTVSATANQFQLIESNFELYRKPLYAVFIEMDVDPPLKIANEVYMGPTVHIRLLTLLAENNLLVDPSKITTLPSSAQMTLPQLKQIYTPNNIRRVLSLSRESIATRRELGHKRFRQDNDMEHACFAYNTGAELAGALVSFNKATQGAYKEEILGAGREQVLCLGNAAEMALGQEFYDRALCYATAAVQCAESLPTDDSLDGVDISIRDKNRRRVARAMTGISQES